MRRYFIKWASLVAVAGTGPLLSSQVFAQQTKPPVSTGVKQASAEDEDGVVISDETAPPSVSSQFQWGKSSGPLPPGYQAPGYFASMQEQQPPPVQPIPEPPPPTPSPFQNTQTPSPSSLTSGIGAGPRSAFGSAGEGSAAVSADRQTTANSATADVVGGGQSQIRNTSDAGSLLAGSTSATGVSVHQRSPISSDPRIRGFRYSQIQSAADSANWIPGRPDLDTALSKIDSSLIRDAITIKGPYNVRQGPGFSFIDIDLYPTPRYESGSGWGGRTALTYDTNGEAWNARQTGWGGDDISGFRLSYGQRNAVDYVDGQDIPVASGYKSRDVDFAYGVDLTSNSSWEIGYLRLDSTDVELPGQINDLRFMSTNGFTSRFKVEDTDFFDRFTLDAYYNNSHFVGDPANKNSGSGNAIANAAIQQGDIYSTGYVAAMTWGQDGDSQLTIGSDLRYYKQEYEEDLLPPNGITDFGIPRTSSINPGLFADATIPVSERLTTKIGARIDHTEVNADPNENLALFVGLNNQTFTTWAAYLSTEYKLNDEWTLLNGIGFAERPPTPTDLYARVPFLSIVQQGGLFFPLGNPLLAPERLKQFDLGIRGEYEDAKMGLNAFYGLVDNFITYAPGGAPAADGFGGAATQNHHSTLWGAEGYLEVQLSDMTSTFANFSYVEGQDQIANVPLWGIFPFQSRIGLRWQDPTPQQWWGLELSANIVDNQDRVNTFSGLSIFEMPTGGYTTYDLRGYYRVNEVWTVVAGVENLTDKFYKTHLDYTFNLSSGRPGGVFQPGRNYFFGFEATY